MLERDVAGCKDISDLEHIVAASLRGRPQFTREGGLLRTRGRPRRDAPTISLTTISFHRLFRVECRLSSCLKHDCAQNKAVVHCAATNW